MEGCGLCGGQLDDHGVRVTLTFAAGLRNGNHFLEVPFRMEDWPICWECFRGDKCQVLRAALADEYIEPVIAAGPVCRTSCAGTHAAVRAAHRRLFAAQRARMRVLFSVRQGSRGEPEEWARCPVCYGPCEVERAPGEAPSRSIRAFA
jgi:hypothetical protein